MGSPLAVFLALRGVRPGADGTQDNILPKYICQRLFNIFHPTDPVVSDGFLEYKDRLESDLSVQVHIYIMSPLKKNK